LVTVALRYFNVFGPRQDPRSEYAAVIPKFIIAALHGSSPVIYGDGEQTRDFTYVDNVVQANLLAMEAPDVAAKVFNIAVGERVTLNRLVELISEITGRELTVEHAAPRPGDVRHSLADIGRAGTELGYRPDIDLTEGLRRTIEWHAKSLRMERRTSVES
jgi:UDP-glucose 4-epimerase